MLCSGPFQNLGKVFSLSNALQGLKQSKRTLVAELQPQKERTASAERRSAEWRATDTSELEAALRVCLVPCLCSILRNLCSGSVPGSNTTTTSADVLHASLCK